MYNNPNNPAIITHNATHNCFEAFNTDGRLIARRGSYGVLSELLQVNYDVVSLNSYCGRSILDQVTKHKQGY